MISGQTIKVLYIGNGVTTVFSFPFKAYDNSDIVVMQQTDLGAVTTLTLGIDYTISILSLGGNVTLSVALPINYKLLIKLERPYTQEADIRNQGTFYPAIHETAFDKTTLLTQQNREIADRSIVFPEFETGNGQLPKKSLRANAVMGFDANGDPTTFIGFIPPLPVSAFMQTMLDDADAPTARGTIGFTGPGGTVANAQLANDSVTTIKILDANVTSNKLANDSVITQKIQDGAVQTNKIADGNVTSPKIGAGAVTSSKIFPGAVDNSALGNGSVTSSKLAAGAVDNAAIANGSVTNSKLAGDSVTTDKIAAGAVENSDIANNAVDTSKILDDAVTFAKIQNIATNKVVGNTSGVTGNCELLDPGLGILFTGSQVKIDNATQVNMESETVGKVVTAENVKFSPSATKAWVNFNGTGVVAIRASYGVTSITDNGVGDYTVNLTTALSSTNYAVLASASRTALPRAVWTNPLITSASAVQVLVQSGGTLGATGAYTPEDSANICVAVLGDQ
jgi:hypothetical protein